MAKRLPRQISVRGTTFNNIDAVARAQGMRVSKLVDSLIVQFLDAEKRRPR